MTDYFTSCAWVIMSSPHWSSEGECLVKVLEDCEEDLVQAWCHRNVLELSDQFCERSVISSECRAHFSSLDHSELKSPLAVRYLLRLAKRRVQTDRTVWENLVELLESLEEVPSAIVVKLRHAQPGSEACRASKSDLAEVNTIKCCESIREEEVVLAEGDVALLTELLVEVSNRWEEIAISLELPGHEIAECRKAINNKLSLSSSIRCWIISHSNPTLSKLKKTLSSKTVGTPTVANKVEEKFTEAKRMSRKNKKGERFVMPRSTSQSGVVPRIRFTSLPTRVADGKSTLLQVEASPKEGVSYQWKKNSQPLANDSRYGGVDEDTLVIGRASQGTEGEYTCCVSLQDRQVSSNPIPLTVIYSSAKQHLLNLYAPRSEVSHSEDSWLPVVSKKFINLALIKPSQIDEVKANYSVRGDADAVLADKEVVEYEEVFGEYKSGELLLVVGRPGSGKTTLVQKLVKDWLSGEVLKESHLVLSVPLRLLTGRQDTSLHDILHDFYSEGDLEGVVREIESKDGRGTCFILDGLDEYLPSNKKESVVYKLLDRNCLPQSMILVFSRPSTKLSEEFISKRVEVFGFDKKDVFEYIENYPFKVVEQDSSRSRADELKEYLLSHPNIHDMCYLPIHAAMICFLFQFDQHISSSQSKVYEQFTRLIIQRSLLRRGLSKSISCLKDLDRTHKKYFKDVCLLAYNMTVSSKQVISSEEIGIELGGKKKDSKEEWSLGLLTVCPSLQSSGMRKNYSFLHLTFQEFLAAYHIANLSALKQMLILRQCSEMEHMRTVWVFYSSLIPFGSSPVRRNILLKVLPVCEVCRIAFELKNKDLCNFITKLGSGVLALGISTVMDSLAIGYVVTASSQPIRGLFISSDNDEDDDTATVLLEQLCQADFSQLENLMITPVINDKGFHNLSLVLKKASEVHILGIHLKLSSSLTVLWDQLEIYACLITYSGTSSGVKTLCSFLQQVSCDHFLLTFTEQESLGIQELVNALQNTRVNLHTLEILRSSMDINCFTDLMRCMQDAGGYKFSLSHNNIQCDNSVHPIQGMTRMASLHILEVSHSNIDCNTVTALASMFQFMPCLVKLDFSHNNLGPDGAAALAGIFKFINKLEQLDLSHNNLGPDGAAAVARELHHLTELCGLDISHNSVDMAGARAVMASLKQCEHAKTVIISSSHQVYHRGIVVEGLVSPEDNSAVSDLIEAAQHEKEENTEARLQRVGDSWKKVKLQL